MSGFTSQPVEAFHCFALPNLAGFALPFSGLMRGGVGLDKEQGEEDDRRAERTLGAPWH